jgi:4-amino-4-deoxychorismate lyase
MTHRCFMGSDAVAAPPADDRGLAYGDGLFETMRAHCGQVPWWDAHWARLERGATRLKLTLPAQAQVRREAAALLGEGGEVLKLLVTRGSGGRGYAPPAHAVPVWQLAAHPLPPALSDDGLTLRWCETRLAVQPALAGIKHCNRLEQVLARSEWSDVGVHEGLMCNQDGEVISATAANVFILRDGNWSTPPVDRSGVAGICRAWVMRTEPVREARIDMPDVETADAVFLCNAVRGILPVACLAARHWSRHPRVVALQQRLAAEHSAFALESP